MSSKELCQSFAVGLLSKLLWGLQAAEMISSMADTIARSKLRKQLGREPTIQEVSAYWQRLIDSPDGPAY